MLGRPVDHEARSARVELILSAARRCFARKGFHAASTGEISEEAGISVANLYQYFPSKRDLVLAIVEADLEIDLGLVEAIARAPSFLKGLKRLLWEDRSERAQIEYASLRLDVLAEARRNAKVAQALKRAEAKMTSALATAIESAQQRGEIARGVNPNRAAVVLLCMGDGYFARLVSGVGVSGEIALSMRDAANRILGVGEIRKPLLGVTKQRA